MTKTVIEQYPRKTVEINVLSVFDEMLVMWQTWHHQEDRSKSWNQQLWQNERSPTVARRAGRTSSRLEVDHRRRPLARRHISDIAQFFSEIAGCCAVQSSLDEDCQFELDTLRST